MKAITGEKWCAQDKLGEDATHRPHVHSASVVDGSKEKLGGAIPSEEWN